jgi:hypothetical protein
MKQVIRLTESDLHRIIKNSVKNVIREADFRFVPDLKKYVADNGMSPRMASKFQRVNAQSGKSYINDWGKKQGMDKRQIGRMVRKGGAPLTTIASDGTVETNNKVTRDKTVLNNVGNPDNRWAADTSTFKRKYQPGETPGVYKPAGGPMRAYGPTTEPISFNTPWGSTENIGPGSYIMQDPKPGKEDDIYGISGEDMKKSYKFDESRQPKRTIRLTESYLHNVVRECVNRALKEGFYSEPTTTYDYDFNSDSTYGNELDGNDLDVQPSLRGESEWNPTEEDMETWPGPEWSSHAYAIGGHHKVGDIVRSVVDHYDIPAGSIVKVINIDHQRGYDIEDVNTGKRNGEFGWII